MYKKDGRALDAIESNSVLKHAYVHSCRAFLPQVELI